MRRSRLTRSDIGAWIVKCNPAIWDGFAEMRDAARPPGVAYSSCWTLGTTYRTDLMEPGDRVLLWITGPHRPGIYEIGTLTGSPVPGNGIEPTYLVDSSRAHTPNYCVDYNAVPLAHPIPRAKLRAHRRLAGCEQFRAPQVANPTYLTPNQMSAMSTLLPRTVRLAAGWC